MSVEKRTYVTIGVPGGGGWFGFYSTEPYDTLLDRIEAGKSAAIPLIQAEMAWVEGHGDDAEVFASRITFDPSAVAAVSEVPAGMGQAAKD